MIGSTIALNDSVIGITAGFAVGLIMLNGIEAAIEYCIMISDRKAAFSIAASVANERSSIHRKKTDIPFDDIDGELNLELSTIKLENRDTGGDQRYSPTLMLSNIVLHLIFGKS